MTLTNALQENGQAQQEFDGYTVSVRDYSANPDFTDGLTQGYGLSIQQEEMPAHHSEVFSSLEELQASNALIGQQDGWQAYQTEQA